VVLVAAAVAAVVEVNLTFPLMHDFIQVLVFEAIVVHLQAVVRAVAAIVAANGVARAAVTAVQGGAATVVEAVSAETVADVAIGVAVAVAATVEPPVAEVAAVVVVAPSVQPPHPLSPPRMSKHSVSSARDTGTADIGSHSKAIMWRSSSKRE
jgi:hypothetical protein